MRVERALETVKKRVVREKLAIRVAQVFGVKHVEAMDELIGHESGYQKKVTNKKTGACGYFQANPCEKLLKICPDMNIDCQLDWGINYIKNRYKTPSQALVFWLERHPIFINGSWRDVGHWY